ncbi:ribonuclease H-like domain-containing protein, partial [Mycena capillaripes]
AQDAQHAFSADLRSTLHLAIPALEKLHAEWTAKSTNEKYLVFHDALKEALLKVDEYYQKTSSSNSYMFAMVLDPRKKLAYFQKNWPKSLQNEATKNMEETVRRYLKMHADTITNSTTSVTQNFKATQPNRRRAVTPLDGDNDNMSDLSATHIDPLRPWLDEYQGYLAAREAVPEGMSTITWWGRNYHRYPVWGFLARDYLAIMASSVSSERAFSSAGITISKRRNRLKGDIVEALQVLKCLIRRDLLFRVPEALVDDEDDMEVEPDADSDAEKDGSWDILVDDDPDNYELPAIATIES